MSLFIIFIVIVSLSIAWPTKPFFNIVYNEVGDNLVNTGFGNSIKQGVTSFVKIFSSKGQAEVLESYSWKSTIDENSNKQDLGVKITSFRANNDIIDITTSERLASFKETGAIVEGYASSTEQTNIEFSCLTENGIGVFANQFNILQVSKNRKEFFTRRCIYPKNSFQIDTNKVTDSQKIKIRASYDFTTESYIPVYFIKKDIFDALREEGSRGPVRFKYNIFEENNIQDEHLNKQDGTVSSVYTKGPVKLELRSQYTQPLMEEDSYILGIRLYDDLSWTGNVEKINELDILMPQEIDIISENFEYVTEEDNFKVYKAKDSLIQELNDVCKPVKQSILKELIDEDCWRRGNIVTSIEFSINDAPDELSKTFIRAKVNYKFSDEKQDTITFLNTA